MQQPIKVHGMPLGQELPGQLPVRTTITACMHVSFVLKQLSTKDDPGLHNCPCSDAGLWEYAMSHAAHISRHYLQVTLSGMYTEHALERHKQRARVPTPPQERCTSQQYFITHNLRTSCTQGTMTTTCMGWVPASWGLLWLPTTYISHHINTCIPAPSTPCTRAETSCTDTRHTPSCLLPCTIACDAVAARHVLQSRNMLHKPQLWNTTSRGRHQQPHMVNHHTRFNMHKPQQRAHKHTLACHQSIWSLPCPWGRAAQGPV
jgi:hypothetical protein